MPEPTKPKTDNPFADLEEAAKKFDVLSKARRLSWMVAALCFCGSTAFYILACAIVSHNSRRLAPDWLSWEDKMRWLQALPPEQWSFSPIEHFGALLLSCVLGIGAFIIYEFVCLQNETNKK